MTIDRRGERAGAEFRRAVDEWGSSEPDPRSFAGFERFQERRRRNRRIAAGIVAATVTVVSVVLVTRAFGPVGGRPVSPAAPGGVILYGERDPVAPVARWHTVRPDGSARRDLDLTATCAVWWPDGRAILTIDDAAAGPGRPLRPAVVDPDGSDLRRLDAVDNPDLNLGCGDVSPDGTTIALEGFGQDGHPELDGIYSIDASDGGALKLLLAGPVAPPRYSPDGTRLSYFEDKAGVSPTGSGALFVMRADGTDPVRITPWGFAFGDHAWSPDGRWIVFQRPYGQLYLVRPDGSGLHRIPLGLPPGAGALNPSWSPDGAWIAFSLQRDDSASIALVRPDGTGLRSVPTAVGELQDPDWVTPSAS
jgi:dipeptidyl aminopeptidase/acylaminoacyl peptidase